MIVPTMSYQEIEKTFRREVQDAWNRIGEKAKKFGSMALKTRLYPFIRSFSVDSKDNTKLSIIFFADKRSYWDHPRVCIYTTFYRKDGLYVISTDNPECGEARIYTAHFFERYRERFQDNEELTTTSLIKQYLITNQDLMWYRNREFFSAAYQKYEHDDIPQLAARVVDGNCFIERLGEKLMLFKTFLSDDMLGPVQSLAFAQLEEMRLQFAEARQKR